MRLCNHSTRTQAAKILDFMATGKPITPMVALRRFGCFRLGARIWDLRKDGHDIKSRLVERKGSRVAEYRLAQ
jgi:hypothetical protein